MGKLSKTPTVVRATGPVGAVQTEQVASGKTFNHGDGFAYDTKSELFLLAVTNFVGEANFYETAEGRDTRYRDLVHANTLLDPGWTMQLLRWLRREANMRSAAIVGAIEAAHVLSKAQKINPQAITAPSWCTPRAILNSVLVRADEPAEALGYWLAVYGKPVPKWLKRALGDAAARLYTPFNVLKWDSARNPIRMADVVEFSQARNNPSGVYKYLLDERHGRGNPTEIPMFAARKEFEAIEVKERRPMLQLDHLGDILNRAGLTWEAVSGWLQGPMDARAWEVCISLMRYGAIIRNLANFDRAGISPSARDAVKRLLVDPVEIKNARLLPMAYLNAYNNVPGDTYKAALDEAATIALGNAPKLTGRTLILIDTSGSMNVAFTTHKGRRNPEAEQLMRWDAAALFGIALGRVCDSADVVSFSSAGGYRSYGWSRTQTASMAGTGGSLRFDAIPGENLLRAVARFRKTHFIGGGTDTAGAVATHYRGHDRMVILTDEQADYNPRGVLESVPADKSVYTFNLAGHQYGHAATGRNRYSVGGLSDKAFAMIAALEQRTPGNWPWSNTDS